MSGGKSLKRFDSFGMTDIKSQAFSVSFVQIEISKVLNVFLFCHNFCIQSIQVNLGLYLKRVSLSNFVFCFSKHAGFLTFCPLLNINIFLFNNKYDFVQINTDMKSF